MLRIKADRSSLSLQVYAAAYNLAMSLTDIGKFDIKHITSVREDAGIQI